MKDRERFVIAFLDSGNNIIETKIMSEGTIGQTAVFPREILKNAIACDCKSMIFGHNHPGLSPNLSSEDIKITQRLVNIFHPLEIRVLDHIIVAGTSYTSMAEKEYRISRHIPEGKDFNEMLIHNLQKQDQLQEQDESVICLE